MYYHRIIGGNNGRNAALAQEKNADFSPFGTILQIAFMCKTIWSYNKSWTKTAPNVRFSRPRFGAQQKSLLRGNHGQKTDQE
jgi:hypothetical protein